MMYLVDKIDNSVICTITLDNYIYDSELYYIIEYDVIEIGTFHYPIWDGEDIVEGANSNQIREKLERKAIEIDLEYTKKISELMMKHNDKFIEGIVNNIPYTIPQDVLNERQRLKDECNQLIRNLGIEDFTYRQSNLKLKK